MSFFLFLITAVTLSSSSLEANDSQCIIKNENGWDLIACSYNSTSISDGWVNRTVYYSLPLGTPPAQGWPVVIMYQGSFFKAELFFFGSTEGPFGSYYLVLTVKNLLDNGFAVLAPDAMFDGDLFWDTNLPPWDTMIDIGLWPTAPDYTLLKNLFAMMKDDSVFGPLDLSKLHCAGISSGGYMSSRMAFFYASQFKSITIESASFYYCSGIICAAPIQGLPGELRPDHPPTLFLHGEEDDIVPISTMWLYADDLKSHNLPYRVVTCADCGHQWIPTAPDEVLNWIKAHNT